MKELASCGCNVRNSGRFSNWKDYDDFKIKLDGIANFESTPVAQPYANVGEIERWYRCKDCNLIWRLVEPDPPFYGFWGQAHIGVPSKPA